MANNNGERSTAPQPDRWYNIRMGSSFGDHSSTKFCMLRYEFKPASIDKKQAGSLHKNKENRVTVEFQNNQPGKQKVTFEGSSEDYKDNDGVLFFDGETFRLERMHRAVKRLRHVRSLGESVAATNQTSASSAGTTMDTCPSPLTKVARTQAPIKPMAHPIPVEVERIDIGEPESPGRKSTNKNTGLQSATLDPFQVFSDPKSYEPEENLDILQDDDGELPNGNLPNQGFGSNISKQNDIDDEIADVDVSDDADEGQNAAAALRAQVNAQEGQQDQETSSSSGSSESGSSESGSSDGSDSSSSDSDGSNNDSASSGGDIDI